MPTSLIQLLSLLSASLVGVVLLTSGVLKALSPSTFYLHMHRLKLMPYGWLRFVIGGSAVVQCVLGVSLILRLYPVWVLPATAALLLVLALFTLWALVARGAEDCGCYGGLLKMSPQKSIVLDVLYLGLIAVAWLVPAGFNWTPATESALFIEPALVFASIIFMSSWVYRRWGQDMVVLSPIKVNKRWDPTWLKGFDQLDLDREQLIVFMSPTCSACKEWTKPLNKIHRRDDMPQVIAGMAGDQGVRDRYATEHGIDFPLLEVDEATLDRLVRAFPTVVQIQDGVIATRGEASLPAHLVNKLRTAHRESSMAALLGARWAPPPSTP